MMGAIWAFSETNRTMYLLRQGDLAFEIRHGPKAPQSHLATVSVALRHLLFGIAVILLRLLL